jgi:hypothetical protein
MEWVADITEDAPPYLRFSQAELARLHRAGVSISDSETTGLNRDRHGFTEFGSIKVVRSIDDTGYRLVSFNAHILPLRPEYQDYLTAKMKAKAAGRPAPVYDPARYEYAIEPKALAVTGTRFLREGSRGPIIGLEVKQPDGRFRRVDAVPFYEVADALVDFLNPRDLYFNAPFDKPFLAAQLRDVYTHRILQNLREGKLEEAGRYGIGPELLRPLSVSQWPEVIHRHLRLPERLELDNPGDYRCLMFGYLHANGPGPSNTLDDAYRALVDPAFTKRPEHKAIEDILMAAKVGLKLEERLGGYPSMAELYGRVLQKADPGLTIEGTDGRDWGLGAALGDLVIRFSKPADQLTGRARAYWDLLADFHAARARNGRTLPHLRDVDPARGIIHLSADRKQPLILPLLRKLMVYERMLDDGPFQRMTPYDSVGNRVDVTVRTPEGGAETIEDTHYGSMRANLARLRERPDEAADDLRLIRDLREADRKVGTVLLRTDAATGGEQIVLKGHLRQLGDVRFHVPAGFRMRDVAPKILERLDVLVKLGLLPDAQGLDVQSESEEEPDSAEEAPWMTQDIFLQDERFELTLTPRLFAAVARRAGVPVDTNRLGALQVTHDKQGVQIAGSLVDFRRVLRHPETDAPTTSAFNAIRDVGWLLYRLGTVPGTTEVTLDGPMVTLRQEPHLAPGALEALYVAGIPFKAYADQVRIDFDQLLHDGFFWSKRLGNALESIKRNAERPASQHRAPPPFFRDLQEALLGRIISAVEADEEGRLWVLECRKQGRSEPPHHRLVIADDGHVTLKGKAGKLDISASSLQGSAAPADKTGQQVTLSPLTAELCQRDMALRHPHIPLQVTPEKERMILACAPEHWPLLQESLEVASRIVKRLEQAHGMAREGYRTLMRQGDRLTLALPEPRLLAQSLTGDLSLLARQMTSSGAQASLEALLGALPQTEGADRRRDHAGPFVEKLEAALPPAEHTAQLLVARHREMTQLNLRERLQEELGNFSLLIHELATLRDHHQLGADGDALFQQVVSARGHIARVAYGIERMEEAMATLQASLLGSEHRQGMHQLIATALIEDSDRLLHGRGEAWDALEQRALACFREAARHAALPDVSVEDIERTAEAQLHAALTQKARVYLTWLAQADTLEKKQEAELRAEFLLQRAALYGARGTNPAEIPAQLAAFRNDGHHTDREALAREALAHCPVDRPGKALQTKALLWADLSLLASGRTTHSRMIEQARQRSDTFVAEATRRAAIKVVQTLLVLRDADQLEDSARQYRARAIGILRTLGEEEEAIQRLLQQADRRHSSPDERTRAAVRLQRWEEPVRGLADPAHHLYRYGAEATRVALQSRERERCRQYLRRLQEAEGETYGDLKLLRDGILNHVPRLAQEAQDLRSIRQHLATYLGETISLLHRDEGRGTMIGAAIDHPLSAVREAEERLRATAARQAMRRYARHGLEPDILPNGDLSINLLSILHNPRAWLRQSSHRTAESPTTTPATVPPAPKASQRELRRRLHEACGWLASQSEEPIIQRITHEAEATQLQLAPCTPEAVARHTHLLDQAMRRYRLGVSGPYFDAQGMPLENGISVHSPTAESLVATPEIAKAALIRFGQARLGLRPEEASRVVKDGYAKASQRQAGRTR